MGKVTYHTVNMAVQVVSERVVELMASMDFDLDAYHVANGISYRRANMARTIRLEANNDGISVSVTTAYGHAVYPMRTKEVERAAKFIVHSFIARPLTLLEREALYEASRKKLQQEAVAKIPGTPDEVRHAQLDQVGIARLDYSEFDQQ